MVWWPVREGTTGRAVRVAIRNGTVVDGTGSAPARRDLLIEGGKVVDAFRSAQGGACRVIDAAGLVVSPGFIDIHTHFDPQLCWDGLATPSLEHGVTTVVTGNCSLSLAPVPRDGPGDLVGMFRIIEDMEESTFAASVRWDWRTFPEYLDSVRSRLGVNVGALMGHSAIRLYVMGPAGRQRAATTGEIDAMCRVVEEGMAAGGLGVSSSYLDVDERGRPVPSRLATRDERLALAAAMGTSGRGVFQVVPFLGSQRRLLDDIRELGDISLAGNVTCSLVPLFAVRGRALYEQLQAIAEQQQRGARVFGQTMARRFDLAMRLSETSLLLQGLPAWRRFLALPRDGRERALAVAADRQRLAAELVPRRVGVFDLGKLRVGDVLSPGNERYRGRLVADIAAEQGRAFGEVVLDIALRDGLDAEFRLAGEANADEEMVAALIESPMCHFGASDAGAHSTQFCGTGDTSRLLSRLVRETGRLSLERAVHRMTGELARDWGIRGRGTLETGQAADVAIFDAAEVGLAGEEFVDDLPGGARRYVRRSAGFHHVLVNGEAMWSPAGYSAARPGEVV